MKIVDIDCRCYIYILQTSLPNIVRSPYKDKLKPQQQNVSLDLGALGSREQDSFVSELDPVIERDENSCWGRNIIEHPPFIILPAMIRYNLACFIVAEINNLSVSAIFFYPAIDFIFF